MRTYRVSEIFGPTMAGEGLPAGKQSAFIRLQLCDGDGAGQRCSWCDTRYTWDTLHSLYNEAKSLTAEEIVEKLDKLEWPGVADRPLVSLTGGNPVLQLAHDGADSLMQALTTANYDVHIETQGTQWKPAVLLAKSISVSPKPPSSGINQLSLPAAAKWARNSRKGQHISYKFVIFDNTDFEHVETYVTSLLPHLNDVDCDLSFYLQPGTSNAGDPVTSLLANYQWLVDRWLHSAVLEKFTVLPQLHVLVWGRKLGV